MIPQRTTYSGQSYKIYDDYNDIHVFVEDAGYENLYKVLLNKYGIRTENVFSKNGKPSVLKAAKTCKDSNCVFIVDRDWDDLLGILPVLNNVVVLNMHSIECYLINYSSFSGILLSENPKENIDTLLSEPHFHKILTDVSNILRPLFKCFLAMQMQENIKKGCSHKPGHFQQKNRSCAPDAKKIQQFITDSGVSIPKSVRDYFLDEVLSKKEHGKFMLHYVWEGVRNKTKIGKIGIEKLMMRLAQVSDNNQELLSLSHEVQIKACKKITKRLT